MLFYIIYYLCISSENLFIHLGTHLVLACIAICVCPCNLLNYYKKKKHRLLYPKEQQTTNTHTVMYSVLKLIQTLTKCLANSNYYNNYYEITIIIYYEITIIIIMKLL